MHLVLYNYIFRKFTLQSLLSAVNIYFIKKNTNKIFSTFFLNLISSKFTRWCHYSYQNNSQENHN